MCFLLGFCAWRMHGACMAHVVLVLLNTVAVCFLMYRLHIMLAFLVSVTRSVGYMYACDVQRQAGRQATAVNIVLYADIWQDGGCRSFGLVCHSYNRDFFTGCEVKTEAFTRVWVDLGGSVHYPPSSFFSWACTKEKPRRFPA